ncbi:hypothetical protein [Leptolyngbya sp. FACHB-321]|uniref:hypothetical protein n=1 Tax=Leptolyngbya sp. FACHB-321 TaxID=2692807 RepID=UPI0018EF8CC0|nr:hypothetical protein [Leptolyngbya sp. FACHB-321]
MPTYTLRALKDTGIKLQPIPSDQLDQSDVQPLDSGTVLTLHSYIYNEQNRHYKVAFLTDSFQGRNTWWAFEEHVEIARDGVVLPQGQSEEKKLNVGWRSQLDNRFNPSITCNVT